MRAEHMVLRRLGPLWALALGLACGPRTDPCFDDRSCEVGQRCEGASLSDPGACVACASTETPYDGVDNDCSTRTPDLDLDGDGDNASNSPVAPGGDCDDNDPTVFSGAFEACADGIDSDCDGLGLDPSTDDPECGDREAPRISVIAPEPGARLEGEVRFRVRLEDDVGVDQLQIQPDPELGPEMWRYTPRPTREVEVSYDSRSIPDRNYTFVFTARDRAGRIAELRRSYAVENGPELNVIQPMAGASYLGPVPVVVEVSDPDGVDRSSGVVRLEGEPALAVSTSTPSGSLSWLVDVSELPDGPTTLEVVVADAQGSLARATVDFAVDTTPPELMLIEPGASATVSETIQVVWRAEDAGNISRLEAERPDGTVESGGSLSLDTIFYPNGPLQLSASAADDARGADGEIAGNIGRGVARIFLDNTDLAPRVSILRPTAATRVLGSTELELDITGGDSMNSVQVLYDGVSVVNLPRPPWRAEVELLAPPGSRELRVIVTDGRGRSGTATVSLSQIATPVLRMALESRPTSGAIVDVQVADFDGDGVTDFVTSGTEVELHAGRMVGGRYLSSAPRRLANVRVGDFALVDLDGDRDLDLVGTDGMQLITLMQDGGVLGSPAAARLPVTGMSRLDAADVDGDGDDDVVLAGAANTAALLYTQGPGSFSLAQTIGGDGGISDIHFVHADGDGNLDIVAARERSRTVSVFRGAGNGSFGAGLDSQPAAPAAVVAVGDVTGDGYPDLILGTADGVELLPGNPMTPGSFGPSILGPGSAEDGVGVADTDGDGSLEILAVDDEAEALVVWKSDGATLLEERALLVGDGPRLLRVADLDGDRRPDSLIARGRRVVRVPFSAGGQAHAPRVIRPGYEVAEFDTGALVGGAPLDLAVIDVTNGAIRVLEGDGRLGFREVGAVSLPPLTLGFDALRVAEIDGMGGVDIAAVLRASAGGSTRGVLLGDGQGSFTANYFMGAPAVDVVVADTDADGSAELGFILSSSAVAENGLELTSGLGTVEVPVSGGGQTAVNAAVGQFRSIMPPPQVVVGNALSENVAVHEWTGQNYSRTLVSALAGLRRISVGRVGTDTLDDVLGVAGTRVFYLEADPAGGFLSSVERTAGEQLVEVHSVDVNLDGLPDLVAIGSRILSVFVAKSAGDFFVAPLEYVYARGGHRLLVADVDGDGRQDLVSSHPASDTLVVVPADADGF